MPTHRARLGKGFHLALFAIGIASFVAHEFAHWVVGESLGHTMQASLNHVWPLDPVSRSHQLLISAAGPALTLILGIAGFVLVRMRDSLTGFALLYMAFFSRLLAAAVSIFNPNDEARISVQLGLGFWTMPAIVVLVLFALTVLASARLKLSLRDQLYCYATASVAVTAVVVADRLLLAS
ncbi:MAG: hypothetical protein WBW92_03600 [Rhodanobacteraceae bacterium]